VILVDSSVWVEFERATNSPTDLRLQRFIDTDAPLAVTEPILMEVLAGARTDDDRTRLGHVLRSFGWITTDAACDFEAAARVYSCCRAAGFTPRGLVDCMIAAIAMRTGSSVLTADRDFARIAEVMPLTLA
jgi:predicted nucleic acid-binding protein